MLKLIVNYFAKFACKIAKFDYLTTLHANEYRFLGKKVFFNIFFFLYFYRFCFFCH